MKSKKTVIEDLGTTLCSTSLVVKDNLSVALELSRIIFPGEDLEPVYRESIDENDPRFRYQIGYRFGKPVGITGHYPDETGVKDLFWLGWFGVIPSHRREGIGKQLIYATVDRVRSMGAKCLRLWCEPDATESHAFYSSVGFVKRSQSCIVQGLPKVVFEVLT